MSNEQIQHLNNELNRARQAIGEFVLHSTKQGEVILQQNDQIGALANRVKMLEHTIEAFKRQAAIKEDETQHIEAIAPPTPEN